MIGPEQAPTRAAVLALKEERTVVGEAYDFLDEKRLLLAAELLKQLDVFERLQGEINTLYATVRQRLVAAVERHGLQGLSVYPPGSLEGVSLASRERNFMGVILTETELLDAPGEQRERPACNPSAEAEACRALFREILRQSAVLAGVSGSLYRLLAEYRLTERRARALENVILPEIEQALNEMTTHLEELDLEDAIRVRYQAHA
jgi:V/A-type H+-transporting ATPase subunit D